MHQQPKTLCSKLRPIMAVHCRKTAAMPMTMLLFLFLSLLSFSFQQETPTTTSDDHHHNNSKNISSLSVSFPLTTQRFSSRPSHVSPSSFVNQEESKVKGNNGGYQTRTRLSYTMALVLSLPIGTPPQTQQMVLDTGSQLSWIHCGSKRNPNSRQPATLFDPSLSSSFSALPCNHPVCKPQIPDFSLPTFCQNSKCRYSYFYADGTQAEGNLVNEKLTLSPSLTTPPLVLGCSQQLGNNEKGILGMNLGRLSFVSQAKISKFSYCIPTRQAGSPSIGSFYLGENPNSNGFHYINLLSLPQGPNRPPNLDPFGYTVAMQGIRVGNKKLDIPPSVFLPQRNGAGQTIIDSGSEFTYLMDEAYNKVREEIVRLVGPKLKKGYMYANVADMCFDGNPTEIGRLIGNMALEFDKGVEIVIQNEKMFGDVGGGVHCLAIGRTEMLGGASNIIGNIHQQNMWVEFDIDSRRIGLGRADCIRS
ncbi:hypothetical protein K2173_023317 [Erythroxylum novogranatense]|uniref:Peptidase A1 domain-containing protein n=1 Tax=Erythroxylum novogranatense TaxID=1862640 RepID=A0AAV8T8Y1_9ROSI|nr:hypothetical protein K2173_023317 [Erythroxylum novogranatense]